MADFSALAQVTAKLNTSCLMPILTSSLRWQVKFGIISCIVLASIYAFIMFRSFKLARQSESLFLIYAISGLAMQFGLQALIHMGSSVHLIPPKA